MERPSTTTTDNTQQTPNTPNTVESQISKSESDGDVVFYMEEPRAGESEFLFIPHMKQLIVVVSLKLWSFVVD